jgi:gamma-glutamyltranspeptidase/glutathione hydrolase
VFAEKTYPEDVLKGLEERGHKFATRVPNTSANSILITKDGFAGAADTRTRGAVAVGY